MAIKVYQGLKLVSGSLSFKENENSLARFCLSKALPAPRDRDAGLRDHGHPDGDRSPCGDEIYS